MHTEWMLGRLELELRERRLNRLGPLLAAMPRHPGLLRRLVQRLVMARRRRPLAPPALSPPLRPTSLSRVGAGRPQAGVRAGRRGAERRSHPAPLPGREGRRGGRWRRCDARWPVDADRLPR